MAGSDEKWLSVATLLRPQGRRGEILADPQLDPAFFEALRPVWLATNEISPASSFAEQVIEHAWQPTGRNAGRVVLKLRGVDSISAAEALSGHSLFSRLQDLPSLDEGTFRVRDLIGCALYDDEHLAGTVQEIQFPVGPDGRTRLEEAPDLLAVQPGRHQDEPESDQELVLIPFVRAWLIEVDLPGRRIRMHLPPGLLEATTSEEAGDSA